MRIYESLYTRRELTLLLYVCMTRSRGFIRREGARMRRRGQRKTTTVATTTRGGGVVEVGRLIPGGRLRQQQDLRRHLL